MTFWNRLLSIIFWLLATGAPARDCKVWGIDNMPRAIYTTLKAWFIYRQCSFFCQVTRNLNCPIVYDQDTCRTYTRLKELSASVDAFAENVSVTTLFPGFSHGPGCMSEYTTQEPFGSNELCCFDIGSWVREPKSQSLSTQSEQVTHLNIETHHKTLWVSAGNKMEKKEKWYKKKKEGKSKLALCACPSARMVW